MRRFQLALLLLWVCEAGGARYAFFRTLDQRGGRRLFGGVEARSEWPGACALLDRGLAARCSCAVLSPRWALTAAHCVAPSVAFVQYYRKSTNSHTVAVRLLYAHPEFRVVQEDQGAGLDVVTLHHDIGLVRTRADMDLPATAFFPLPTGAGPQDPNHSKFAYNIDELIGREIDVLGFGMTDQMPAGERLREVRLRLVSCGHEDWWNCACALGAARGVCAGDSGGPVLYNGTQIGVTSMGPVECGAQAGAFSPTEEALSVFTALRPYASLIDETMRDVDTGLRMRIVPLSAAPRRYAHVVLGVVSLLCRCSACHHSSKSVVELMHAGQVTRKCDATKEY